MNAYKKFSLRKIFSVALVFILAAAGSLTATTPASALGANSNWGKHFTFYVGETVNLPLGCEIAPGESLIYVQPRVQDGYIPNGIPYQIFTGVLSGAATEPGEFTYGDWYCFVDAGGVITDATYSSPLYNVTITVLVPTNPAPSVTVTPLNNADCEFRVVGKLAADSGPGATKLLVSADDGSTAWEYTLADYTAAQLIDLTVSAKRLGDLALNPNVVGTNLSGVATGNLCGVPLSVSIRAQNTGFSESLSTVPGLTINESTGGGSSDPAPYLSVSTPMASSCDVVIVGSMPQAPMPGSAVLTIDDSLSLTTLNLRDLAPGEQFSFRYTTVLADLEKLPFVWAASGTGENVGTCNANYSVTLSYQYTTAPAISTTRTVTTGAKADGWVFGESLRDDACNVRVVGYVPSNFATGSLSVELLAPSEYITKFAIADPGQNSMLDFTFSALDTGTVTDPDIVGVEAFDGIGTHPNFCTQPIGFLLTGRTTTGEAFSFRSATDVVAGQIYDVPQLTLTAIGGEACVLRVSGVMPLPPGYNRYLRLSQTDHPETLLYQIDLTSLKAGELFTYDLPLASPEEIAALPGGSVNPDASGPFPWCNTSWTVALGADVPMGSIYDVEMVNVGSEGAFEPSACAPGYWSESGVEPCIPASAGSYVPSFGATRETPCAIGFYSDVQGAGSCIAAAKGRYVAFEGAATSMACPTGQTTFLTGARSIHECYKLLVQTVKGIKILKTYKYAAKIYTQMTTDGGQSLSAVVVGVCSVARAKLTMTVKGKKTQVDRFLITAGKKAGTCKVTFNQKGDDTYAPLTVVKTFKVSKTGK